MQIFLVSLYILLSALGLVFFKIGSNNGTHLILNKITLSLQLNLLSVLGIACYGFSFLLYLYLVSKYNLSYIYPLTTGAIYLIVFVLSITILKETVLPQQLAGSTLVLLGIILLNLKK